MLILSNFYLNQGPILCSKPHLKSENPGGGGLRLSWGFPNPNDSYLLYGHSRILFLIILYQN